MPTPDPRTITGEIIVSDRLSDANKRRVPVSALSVSWELSGIGQLTCNVQMTDLDLYGIDHRTLLSKWLRYRHPTAGAWGGIVQTLDADSGTLSIGAESWASALRGVTTQANIAAGSRMIATLMNQIDLTSVDTGIKRGLVDTQITNTTAIDLLPEFDFFSEGQDLLEQFLPNVMQRWYDEFDWLPRLQAAGWNVDPTTRLFRFDATYGQDLTKIIALRDRQHAVGSGWSADTTDIVNRVLVPGTQKVGETWVNVMLVGHDDASIVRHGQHSALYPIDAPGNNPNPRAWAQQRAIGLARQEQSVTFDIVDESDIFAYVREGDLVTAMPSNSRVEGPMVVRSRALNVDSGVMTISGEAMLGLL